jgi:hypothetical protein
MICDKISEMLVDYISEELQDRVKRDFESHISSCEKCSKIVKEFDLTYQFVRNEKVPCPSVEFWNDLNIKLLKNIDSKKNEKVLHLYPFKRILAFAASILIIVMAGFYLNHSIISQDGKMVVEGIQQINKNHSFSSLDIDNQEHTRDGEYENSLILKLKIQDNIDANVTIEEEFEQLSNLAYLLNYSTEDSVVVDNSNSEYVLTELLNGFNGDFSGSLIYFGSQRSTFFDPWSEVDDLYDEYKSLTDKGRQLFQSGLKHV